MQVTIYHNPRCSKSRQTMALLEQQVEKQPDMTINVVEYLKQPLTSAQLTQVAQQLGAASVREIMRTSESAYKEQNLAATTVTDEQLLDAIVSNPILLQRPIVINQGKAVIGRPPENVLSLFE